MQGTLTAKVKLLTTPEQAEQLRCTALAYRDALNFTSRTAFANGKLSTAIALHKLVYRDLRVQFGLSAQLACNVPRQVAATYKGLWSKVKQNAQHRAKGHTPKRNKGLDKPPKYVSMTTTLSYGYDYRFKTGQQVSITTLAGRLVGYTPHLDAIRAGRRFEDHLKARKRQERNAQQSQASASEVSEAEELAQHEQELDQAMLLQLTLPWAREAADEADITSGAMAPAPAEANGITFGAAKLWRDPRTKQWYLLVTIEMPLPDPTPATCPKTKGIDLGQRYLAVSTTPENETQFIPGGHAVHQGEAYQRVRTRLQHKGTRKATARLRQMRLRERRFKADINHATAKALVAPGLLIGLEDLTHIRDRTKQKGKRHRRKAAKWAFAELRGFVSYKAALAGSVAVTVDADYTSQQCPWCGYRSKANRPKHGLLFRCANPDKPCGYEGHADLVGARQVCLHTLVIRQHWITTGHLSPVPDGASDEAKAARLQRYAEVRWRTASSSRLQPGVV
jgi:IS605 OrfB family transposase